MLTTVASFVCPQCGSDTVLVTESNAWECLVCGVTGRVDPTGKIWMESPQANFEAWRW